MTTGPASSSRLGPSPQHPRFHLNRVFDGPSGRVLCIADIRGQHSLLNKLAAETQARAIIHTGDFGFFETASLDKINDRTLKHLVLYSPLIPNDQRDSLFPKEHDSKALRETIRNSSTPYLSEFPSLLSGNLTLDVPVYTVWGACEDVSILEKLRTGEYSVENLHVIDEATSRTLEIGGIKLRLFGLGGAFVPHKLFDNGEGQATIAGGSGTMWMTALQIGELVDTAQRNFDQAETRLLVTHASPGREGLLAQLALALKADLTISAALHFRYASSWNEFSVQTDADAYRNKLGAGKDSFTRIWESVKSQVEGVMDENQKLLLEKALMVSDRVPPASSTNPPQEEAAWKNTWNWNLSDASFGHLILDIRQGRVSAELKSQGFNFAYRRAPLNPGETTAGPTPAGALHPLPSAAPTSQALTLARPSSQQGPGKPQPNGAVGPAPAGQQLIEPPPAPLRPALLPAPNSQVVPNGVHGSNKSDSSPKSPGAEVAAVVPGSIASPAPSGGKPDGRAKKFSNAERRERKREKSAASISEAENTGGSKDGVFSKAASPAPVQNTGKHNKRGSRASGTGSPASLSSPLQTPAPAVLDANGHATSSRATAELSPNPRSPPLRTLSAMGPKRHPWTLYLSRLPVPVTEQEVRECFEESRDAITFVKLPYLPSGGQRPIAFVEFKDEISMQAALAKNSGKIKDQHIRMIVADNRDRKPSDEGNTTSDNADGASPRSFQGGSHSHSGGFSRGGGSGSRGGFRSRGGGRGGALFQQAQRGLVQGASGRGGGPGMRRGSTDGAVSPSPGPAA